MEVSLKSINKCWKTFIITSKT